MSSLSYLKGCLHRKLLFLLEWRPGFLCTRSSLLSLCFWLLLPQSQRTREELHAGLQYSRVSRRSSGVHVSGVKQRHTGVWRRKCVFICGCQTSDWNAKLWISHLQISCWLLPPSGSVWYGTDGQKARPSVCFHLCTGSLSSPLKDREGAEGERERREEHEHRRRSRGFWSQWRRDGRESTKRGDGGKRIRSWHEDRTRDRSEWKCYKCCGWETEWMNDKRKENDLLWMNSV